MVEEIKNMADEDLKTKFEELYNSLMSREGSDKLLEFIRKSDFYKAPASTRFHGCVEGGLLRHSMLVYACLIAKRSSEVWIPLLMQYTDETLFLVSALHDLCKTYFYVVDYKNQKVYSDAGTKSDVKGKFDWETVPFYTVDNKYPMGHGEKSIFFITSCGVVLRAAEWAAIRWHMGYTEPKENWNDVSAAMEKYPICLALHEADQEASHIFEI